MQEIKSKSYEMIDVNVFVNKINLPPKERSYTVLLYYLQDYRPCSSRKDFPQKWKLGWYLAIFMKSAHILHWNYGKQCWNLMTLYRPNVKMATLVSYSFVYIQISLTSLVLKCKIPKNTLSQGRLVRLISI